MINQPDNFRIERTEENGEMIVRVSKLAGAKGQASSPVAHLQHCAGSEKPVLALYQELAEVDITQLTPMEIPTLNKRIEETLVLGTEQYRRMESARIRLARAGNIVEAFRMCRQASRSCVKSGLPV